ncbi:NADH:ubiquinone oxidoreductase subunit L [Neisseria elongata subsp. glycolytica ATCC 29315]|uniref:NADH dehydrogenase subunit L n=1 Tax=Neisseria elongata subsp. glycolytica ATCC 29315 TaxID=546263 RepID=D4DSX0_NEIEG|nr:NADH-quinone oxidoreductase subunit L [Neisseria elongata]AJE19012.1 NADH:ubiquinone oxidoreductase subunit L [Neisseria elongata subsp. glycolytica ATCC 29315]EFE49154.1 NADH dehydrogenase subunit L [Neisseria elongata subsp. glycolytica ATCC 29315]SQH50913.1 NADH:ubiquinone dehydrogenase, L subunit [Neisseria elongata subsp. glycolytica]
MTDMTLYLIIALTPLAGCLLAGLFGNTIGRRGAHTVTILGVAVSAVLSAYVLCGFIDGSRAKFDENVYTWLTMNGLDFSVGFLVDSLTALMMVVVTSVSLMVHIYTIGYMADEEVGYQRFFSYISLFTFSMLMLIMSNNFIQLFFGWEAVGLVSYLLIGFYFKRDSAIFANLKAFLVNRVGDFGFVLGIGLVLAYFGGSLRYADVFAYLPNVVGSTLFGWDLITITCLLLFVGAMGKSAQFPLHVWLPDSMEGPTPISALIHAATMVTAGLFMVSRMSPIYELSTTALSVIMVIGAITALFMGFLGTIQNDIKRVVAYSTLSQLGYMTVALGVSAYSVAMFHVMTHAFFKALLFLAAGSVIIGMHHDQDMRNMGGLRKYMPITWFTMLLGNLALIGTPLFSGFYSKDSIIEAVHASNLPGSGFAYFAVLASVFVTAFYAFRQYFIVFHGKERWREAKHDHHDDHGHHHGLKPSDNPHESPWVVTLPLILLAIPSVIIGYISIEPMLYGNFFKDVIYVNHELHPVMNIMKEEFHGAMAMVSHSLHTPVLYLAIGGVLAAWFLYVKAPQLPAKIAQTFRPVYVLFENKYYLDNIYFAVFAKGTRALGTFFWKAVDTAIIDNGLVNGAAKLVGAVAGQVRRLQTGFIYTYAAAMISGVLVLIVVFFWQLWFR